MNNGDEEFKAKIIKRLKHRASSLDERTAARERIELEKIALARAEREGRRGEIYHHLVNIGTCYSVLKEVRETVEYFKRAVREFPDKRYPLYVLIMALAYLGENREAEEYPRLYEKRFPPRYPDK